MDNLGVIVGVVVAVLVAACLGWLFYLQRKAAVAETTVDNGSNQLQLQAYERLTLLVDRIALTNIITNVSIPEFSCRDMQQAITQQIKQEFEYNITQQIYVSTDAWIAVKNLKDKSILMVNELANALPPEASGLDLSKLVLEYQLKNSSENLNELVSNLLSFEAKKLL